MMASTRGRMVAALMVKVLTAGAAVTVLTATAARAEPVPAEQRVVPQRPIVQVNPTAPRSEVIGAGLFGQRADGAAVTPGATARLSAYSCGRLIAQSHEPLVAGAGATGIGDFVAIKAGRVTARELTLVLDVTEPGYDAYQVSQTVDLLTDKQMTDLPTCTEVEPADPYWNWPTVIETWSVKKGPKKARIGKKLVVTEPRLSGGDGYATCDWRLNRRRIVSMTTIPPGACGALKVKPSYRGKRISVVVTVSDLSDDSEDQVRTLSYGRARR